jgi:hypothetical protein
MALDDVTTKPIAEPEGPLEPSDRLR